MSKAQPLLDAVMKIVLKKEKIAFSYRELADVVRYAEPAGVEEQRFVQ